MENQNEEKIKDEIARNQGVAFVEALRLMQKKDPHAEVEVEDYLVSVAAEEAEGMYAFMPEGGLEWQTPLSGDNQHIEIVVQDKDDLRFVPCLEIRCKVFDSEGKEIGEESHPFIWHPFLYHYGANWEIPGEGDYIVEARINKPMFMRHDEVRGKRYLTDVIVELGPIHLKPGVKPHGEE